MSINRRVFTESLAALGVAAATPALAAGATVEVSMKQSPKMLFVPASVNIKAGDTVKWTNPYNITHTVTFDPAQAQTASDVSLPAGVTPFGSGDIEEAFVDGGPAGEGVFAEGDDGEAVELGDGDVGGEAGEEEVGDDADIDGGFFEFCDDALQEVGMLGG